MEKSAMTTAEIARVNLEQELSRITKAIELARTRLRTTRGWTRLFITKRFARMQRRRRAVEARLRQLEDDATGSPIEAFDINAPMLGAVCSTGFMAWLDRIDARHRARAAARRGDRH